MNIKIDLRNKSNAEVVKTLREVAEMIDLNFPPAKFEHRSGIKVEDYTPSGPPKPGMTE